MAKDAPKMRGWRPRDATSGRLRKKRADTKVATIEKRYRRSLGRDSLQLGTLLKRRRRKSLKALLK